MARMIASPFRPLHGCTDAGVFAITGKWAIGATGAVGTQTRATGLTLTRSGVGAYTLQLRDSNADARAVAILFCAVQAWVNDADPTNDTDAHQCKHKLITDSTGAITVQFEDEGGTVRELPSGAVVTVFLTGTISSVTR